MNHGPQRKTPRSERNESNKRLAPLSEFQSWDSADDTLRAQGAAPGPGLHPRGQGAGVCGRARPEAQAPLWLGSGCVHQPPSRSCSLLGQHGNWAHSISSKPIEVHKAVACGVNPRTFCSVAETDRLI